MLEIFSVQQGGREHRDNYASDCYRDILENFFDHARSPRNGAQLDAYAGILVGSTAMVRPTAQEIAPTSGPVRMLFLGCHAKVQVHRPLRVAALLRPP